MAGAPPRAAACRSRAKPPTTAASVSPLFLFSALRRPSLEPAPVLLPSHPPLQGQDPAIPAPKFSEEQRLAPLRALLATRGTLPAEEVAALSATQVRRARGAPRGSTVRRVRLRPCCSHL